MLCSGSVSPIAGGRGRGPVWQHDCSGAPHCFRSRTPTLVYPTQVWSLPAGLWAIKLRHGFSQTPPILGRSQAQAEVEDDHKDDEGDEDHEDEEDDGSGEGAEFSRFSLASERPPER